MAIQAAGAVAITGGSIDMSGGTLTLANDQISGDKVSGGTIDSANLSGGAGKTISAFDVTIGAGKTLDVDGIVDIDGAATSAMDNVAVGTTTSAAGKFTTMESGSVNIDGGAIDGTIIGATVAAAIDGTNISASGTLKANTLDNYSGSNIAVSAPMDITGDVGVTGSVEATVAIVSDTISERTGAAGVTADGVLLKDGNVTATLTGNVTGDVTGDLTGNSAGVHTGNVTGNLTGNSAGTHTGAVVGNVTGNVTGDLTGASAGVHTGNVTGDLTGNSAGTHTGSVNVSGDTLTLADNQISGDKLHGGTYSNFTSTGITDSSDQTVLTLGAVGFICWCGNSCW
jgi:hypothetical protein